MPNYGVSGDFCRCLSNYPVSRGRFSRLCFSDVRPLVVSRDQEFAPAVQKTSAEFCATYNEAYRAEANGLTRVCGPGYRKALEFLIKDFLICKCPNHQEKIIKSRLGRCIDEYVDDERIKAAAKRAAWLGNDETHYYRRWSDKDVQDLKKLISMTVNWIDLVILSEEYQKSMPDPSE